MRSALKVSMERALTQRSFFSLNESARPWVALQSRDCGKITPLQVLGPVRGRILSPATDSCVPKVSNPILHKHDGMARRDARRIVLSSPTFVNRETSPIGRQNCCNTSRSGCIHLSTKPNGPCPSGCGTRVDVPWKLPTAARIAAIIRTRYSIGEPSEESEEARCSGQPSEQGDCGFRNK